MQMRFATFLYLSIGLFAANLSVFAAPLESRQNSLVGYLAAYFKGVDENIFLSVSNGNTAYEFSALNGGNAYLTPSAEGGTGGVRDPYLFASPDRSMFWIIGTDLNIDQTTYGKP